MDTVILVLMYKVLSMFTFNTRPKTSHANPKQERIWPKVAEY